MKPDRSPTTDAVEILRRRIDPTGERSAAIQEERANLAAACLIHDLRESGGLTQGQLARRAAMTPDEVRRLEEGVYEGHLLGAVWRIASALGTVPVLEACPERPAELVSFFAEEVFPSLRIPSSPAVRQAMIDEAIRDPAYRTQWERWVEGRNKARAARAARKAAAFAREAGRPSSRRQIG